MCIRDSVKPAAEHGWGATQTLALGAGSLVLLAAFIAWEATTRNPLIPLRIFRSRNVSGANVIQALTVAGMFGLFFLGSLYLEQVLGYDPLQIGFAFLPATLIMGVLSFRYTEPLISRFGARRALLAGLVLVAAGLALFSRAPVDGDYLADVLPPMVILGLGIGVSFPSLMSLAMWARRVRTRALLPASSTRPPRWVARSASRCWRRCRPRGRVTWLPPASRRRRLW